MEEVQNGYRLPAGRDISCQHIEIIVHQMLRRITVIDSGDTDLLPGELLDQARFQAANMKAVKEGGKPCRSSELMGITKASLAAIPGCRGGFPSRRPPACLPKRSEPEGR